MKTPIVTESPRALEPVAPDPFIDGLKGETTAGSKDAADPVPRQRPQGPPAREQ